MEEQKSEAYRKAEAKAALVLFLLFIVWCPVYLIFVRPIMNDFLAGHVNSYPAILHLVPILGPIIIIGLIAGKFMPSEKG